VPTNYPSPITNTIDVFLYCWILSADFLSRTQAVTTLTLALNSTNVVLDDPLLVSSRMEIKAESLTVNDRLRLTDELTDWTHALTPGLRYSPNRHDHRAGRGLLRRRLS
jgi:hypothetical protein